MTDRNKQVKIEIGDGHSDITLHTILEILGAIASGVATLDHENRPNETIEYYLVDQTHSLPTYVQEARCLTNGKVDVYASYNQFVELIKRAEGFSLPDYELSRKITKSLKTLLIGNGKERTPFHITTPSTSVVVKERFASAVEGIKAKSSTYIGTLAGRLDHVMDHEDVRWFEIWPSSGVTKIKCDCSPELMEVARGKFKNKEYVKVKGEITYDEDSLMPKKVRVSEFLDVSKEDDQPDILSLRGAAKHCTGDKSTAEFLGELRDEWE